MDSDPPGLGSQQTQQAQHAQQAQQAQHDFDAEFEDFSPEALAELDQVLAHAHADPGDALAACTLQEPQDVPSVDEEPLTKLQQARARLATKIRRRAVQRGALAKAGAAGRRAVWSMRACGRARNMCRN